MQRSNDDHYAGLVSELCALPGPPGAEEPVRKWLLQRWATSVEEIDVGPGGNVVARVGGTGRRVALIAHMDEVGYFVTHLRDDGFAIAEPLRAWPRGDPRRGEIPIGHPARIVLPGGQYVEGLFGAVTGHVATDAGPDAGWWIDVGCSSAGQLAELGVHVGAPVVPVAPARRVRGRLTGKAMDDRALLAAITALLERPGLAPSNELWVAATVQEETGAIGASALHAGLAADVALMLDVAPCGRLPGQPPDRFPVDLGLGPVIVHKDVSMVYDRGVGAELAEAARAIGLPVQNAVFRAYFTDGRELARSGARTAVLALPCRYTHSAFETIDLEDLVALVELLAVWA